MAKKNKNIKYKKMLPATPAETTGDDKVKPYDFEPIKSSVQNFEFFNIFNECKKMKKGMFADQSSASSSSFSYDLYKMEKNYPSPKRKRKRGPKFRTEGEKPAYMENDMDREGKIILKSDMIKNLEKYRKV